jgi:glycine/D-amino acid oxidase-like deaminating enzyme
MRGARAINGFFGTTAVGLSFVGVYCANVTSPHPQMKSISNANSASMLEGKGRRRNVVIVGGGIVGLSTAIQLASSPSKYNITVVERLSVGHDYQASSINSGFIEALSPVVVQDDDELINSLETTYKSFTLDEILMAGSKAMFEKLQSVDGYKIGFRRMGFLQLIFTDGELQRAKSLYPSTSITSEEPCPHTGAVITTEHMLKLEPILSPKLLGAVWFPDSSCATANPRKAMLGFKGKAESMGVKIVEYTEVVGIEREGGGKDSWSISTREFQRPGVRKAGEEGLIPITKMNDTDMIIIAGGGLTPYVGSLIDGVEIDVLPVVPVVGQMFSTPTEAELLASNNNIAQIPARRMEHLIGNMESETYWVTNNMKLRITHERSDAVQEKQGGSWGPRLTRHLYGKQCKDGSFIFGGDRRVHPTQHIDLAHQLPRCVADMLDGPRELASEAVPTVSTLPVKNVWGGIMPFTIDGAPLIGKVPGVSNVYVVSGLGGSGFMRGPMAGKLLGLLIEEDDENGKIAAVLQGASPLRFTQTVSTKQS